MCGLALLSCSPCYGPGTPDQSLVPSHRGDISNVEASQRLVGSLKGPGQATIVGTPGPAKGYTLQDDEIRNDTGEVVARVGEQVQLGGGEVSRRSAEQIADAELPVCDNANGYLMIMGF